MAERNDEIDLLELLARTVLIVRNNFKIILVAFISGTLLGLSYYQFVPRVYESKMILTSDILLSSYSERITESINRLIREHNTELLSQRLQLSREDAGSISKIEIESVKNEVGLEAKSENEIFLVTAYVVDRQILPKLQEGLINYLRNNEFVKVRVEQRKKYYQLVIAKMDEELADLEKLKIKVMNGEFIQGSREKMVLFDPSSINTKIVEMNKEKLTLQNRLETANSIQLMEGFTAFEQPVSPKLFLSLSGGAMVGLIFVAALIAFQTTRKLIGFSEKKLGQS